MTAVRDNKAKSRFELDVEGAVAFANYRLAPGAVIITHTETPQNLRGRGIASELVQGALGLIRAATRPPVVKPGSTRIRFCRLRTKRPAPISRTSDRPTCAATAAGDGFGGAEENTHRDHPV